MKFDAGAADVTGGIMKFTALFPLILAIIVGVGCSKKPEWPSGHPGSHIHRAPPAGQLTISVVETKSGPMSPGPEDHVALQVKLVATGAPMPFTLPIMVIRKSGGAPWKSLAQVRSNISDLRIIGRDGTLVTDPLIEIVGDEQCSLRDENTLIIKPSGAKMSWTVSVGDPQYVTVLLKIGANADVSTLSVGLEASPTTGAVVGPTRIIAHR